MRKLYSPIVAYFLLFDAFALAVPAFSAAGEGSIQLTPDLPFRRYSIADGLMQSVVTGITQDANGYIWVSTFGGVNRFDGQNFIDFTVDDGLRKSLIYHMGSDDSGRIWAGDSEGGLTYFENSEIRGTVAPSAESIGVVRDIQQIGDVLYVATEPGGLAQLNLKSIDHGLHSLKGTPNRAQRLVLRDQRHMLIVSVNSLWDYDIRSGESTQMLSDIGFAERCGNQIFVSDQSGRIGRLANDNTVLWDEEIYPGAIRFMACNGESLAWIFADGVGTVRYGNPSETYSVSWSEGALVDRSGVLWVTTRKGLQRFLGNRFRHYSLSVNPGDEPEVFAVRRGPEGDLWLGTSDGLLNIDDKDDVTNINDRLGLDRREVRDLRISEDARTIWLAQAYGPYLELDLDDGSAKALSTDTNAVLMGMEQDSRGHVWVGSYFGKLFRYDPSSEDMLVYELGDQAPIYALDVAEDGWLWFAAGNRGLFRIDTRRSTSKPELVVPADQFEDKFFTQVHVELASTGTEVWVSTLEGGLYRWSSGQLRNVLARDRLRSSVLTQFMPVNNKFVVLGSTGGAYRFDLESKALESYLALDGFTAIEAKIHANLLEKDTLWIGTTSGLTAMDITERPAVLVSPNAFLLRGRTADSTYAPPDLPAVVERSGITVSFDAVSSRRPDEVEFSYRLLGTSEKWSAPIQTRSVNYSSLSPGSYRFEVRARLRGLPWSRADSWVFDVPKPYWQSYGFIAAAALLFVLLVRVFISLRMQAVERVNARLREQVSERTASIEAGRLELENINAQLSREMSERVRADELREDVEARFHQAYQNAPIGMALVDSDGRVYDANPHLKELFWPEAKKADRAPLVDVVVPQDRGRFQEFLEGVEDASDVQPSMEFDCTTHDSSVRTVNFLPSPVRSRDGSLRYIMLLAEDVTERRALTDQLAHQARFDELTGLLNRRAFTEHLAAVERSGDSERNSYLLFIDLDQFKVVNDTCGHAAGDKLLKKVSEVIRQGIRDGDVVARLGGDEFALILGPCREVSAVQRAEQIRVSIRELEFHWDAELFRIGASIGLVPIAVDTADASESQRLADAACYAAKEAGRNRVHLVHGSKDAAYEHRGELRWVQRINQGIEHDRFVLFGQRIQALGEHKPNKTCIEVLLRLRDSKDDRLIPPNAFMPAAERFGLNSQLDLWVVRNAIETMLRCDAETQRQYSLGINLCGASLSDSNFARELIALVTNAALPSGALTLEITETSVIRRMDEASRIVEQLRALGCYISLDDFGSGRSSFGYLKHLNVDSLKIDGEFVRDMLKDPTDRLFVKFIVDTAHALDKRVVAEFVESQDLLLAIEEMGCDYAQGFAIHKPELLSGLLGCSPEVRAIPPRVVQG
ncbi:MAG: EAL domain-containing protein [Pseudomonadota bacterium]